MTKILVDKAVLNQCDGCMQGAAMRGIYHIDKNGKSFMTCQKSKYMCPQPHCQPPRTKTATPSKPCAPDYASDMTKSEGLSGCDCPICTVSDKLRNFMDFGTTISGETK